jgi:hypothetical protein
MFAKLFSSITESSLWSEPKEVRLLFVTMLAKADQSGFVEASIPGLARVANLSVEETEASLQCLQSPDKYSKNPDNEGRRVLVVPGGFMLLNYEEYRSRRSTEERREYMRGYMKNYRQKTDERKHDVNTGKPPLSQAEAEAEAEAEKTKHKVAIAPVSGFKKPTIQEVIEYIREIQAPIDAKEFIDYYTSNGWKIGGRAAMKDWKATVRQWEARRRKDSAETANVSRFSEAFVETLKICKQYPGRESYETREQHLGKNRVYALKKSGGSSALIEASGNSENLRNFAAVFESNLKDAANGIKTSN